MPTTDLDRLLPSLEVVPGPPDAVVPLGPLGAAVPLAVHGLDVADVALAAAEVTFPAAVLEVAVRVVSSPGLPTRFGVAGRCFSGSRIVVLARPGAARDQLSSVLAHELGHAYDRQVLDVVARRGLARHLGLRCGSDRSWFARGRPWHHRMSECYAEIFARRWAPAPLQPWRFSHWMPEPPLDRLSRGRLDELLGGALAREVLGAGSYAVAACRSRAPGPPPMGRQPR